jgi:hypothetical protein
MDNLINPIASEVVAAVQSALVGHLGEYERPDLPNRSAIYLGRKMPANWKVAVAADKDPPIPALEVIVDAFPEYALLPSNFRTKGLSEMWRIWLIFHDDRQFPRDAIRAIVTKFQIVDLLPPLQATDLNPHQYQILIAYNNRLPVT